MRTNSQIPQPNMKTIEQQIKQFKEETGYDLEIKDGKPHYDGYLYLRGIQITALPDNLTVGGSIYLQGTQITDTSMVKRNVPEIIHWQWNNKPILIWKSTNLLYSDLS